MATRLLRVIQRKYIFYWSCYTFTNTWQMSLLLFEQSHVRTSTATEWRQRRIDTSSITDVVQSAGKIWTDPPTVEPEGSTPLKIFHTTFPDMLMIYTKWRSWRFAGSWFVTREVRGVQFTSVYSWLHISRGYISHLYRTAPISLCLHYVVSPVRQHFRSKKAQQSKQTLSRSDTEFKNSLPYCNGPWTSPSRWDLLLSRRLSMMKFSRSISRVKWWENQRFEDYLCPHPHRSTIWPGW